MQLGECSIDWGRRAAEGLLTSGPRPEAVVCADDLIAFGVLQACTGAGVRVPEDLLVTGFDDVPFAALSNPPLTTVRQPQAEIAAEAVRLLSRVLGDEHAPPSRVALTPSLTVRESTGR